MAAVARLIAISVPLKRVVKTRPPASVVAPSGMEDTFVSNSTSPVAGLSASISPVVGVTPAEPPLTESMVFAMSGRPMVATHTLPSATARLVSTPPSAPGSNV
jgi:hypothetical protein